MNKIKSLFQKLTPLSDADISVYQEALDFAFKNSDIKNVAISGAYSSGKSSILETYKSKCKEYRFIHISLAHFRTPEQENMESEVTVKESVLEGKILNQLIHQIPAKNIPQTKFKVKKDVSFKCLILLTTFASLFMASVVYLFTTHRLTDFLFKLPEGWLKNKIAFFFSPYMNIIATLICATCSLVLIYLLIKVQMNKSIFHKISLQGTEIEIFEDNDDSYFDKYLNEVLYLFEKIDADVIVFEDMDRFNANGIFERLHEVNTLVNIHRKKNHRSTYKPLRFFYLLRDDIFVSKDRTKFFDYIIPVVPVVDNSNSFEQLLKLLNEGNLLDNFDQSFLQGLSLYIDDMRILKNIYNEFIIYINRLNTTDLNWNKMLAIISYKNLFPRDFSDLQLARGFIFTLFEQKPNLVEDALESANVRKQELLERIEWVKSETLTSLQELDDAYDAKNGRLPRSPYNQNVLTKESQEMKVLNDAELSRRKMVIKDNLDDNIKNLEADLDAIEREIALTHTKTLHELITRKNIANVFSVSRTNEIDEVNEFKEIKSSDYFDLLKFLIRNGYVDETYADYMTYFYEDKISSNDKKFLRRITDRRGSDFTYALVAPEKIINSPLLRVVEFEQEEALNFDLLEYLLINQGITNYSSYLNTLIMQIMKSRNFVFVSKFYETGKALKQFVMIMNNKWPEFFSLALHGKGLPSSQIRQYSIDTLCYSDNDSIIKSNIDYCLTSYISQCQDYLDIYQPEIEKLIAGFSHLGVSFISIDYDKSNDILFDEVYRNSLYAFNFENIALMLRKKYGIEKSSDIIHKNFTLVQSDIDSPLAKYVSRKMPDYLEIILANCNGSISDDEAIAISLLNNSDIEIIAKFRYIKFLSSSISEITNVNESELWTELINKNAIPFSVDNLINYFQKFGIDETIIGYINNEPSDVDFSSSVDNFGEEILERLFDAVAICNSIKIEKYRKILIDLGYCFENFEADEISNEKLDVLVENKIIQMDSESLIFVREKYADHLYMFIQRNLDMYLSLQTPDLFRLDEALEIIKWDIDDLQKIELLKLTHERISVVGKQYSDMVIAYIIIHNLNADEKSLLFANYTQYGEKAQESIIILAITSIDEIILNNLKIDDELLTVLLQASKVARNKKIALFTMTIPDLNEESCKAHFDDLELSDLKSIFAKNNGRRNYEKCDEVSQIFEALKTNNWIYDYRDDERNNERYIVIRNRPREKDVDMLD